MQEQQRFLTISDLNRLLNMTLEEYVGLVSFEGEICELTLAGSGHLYATLKDETAEVRIILWSQVAKGLSFRPEVGMHVRCQGRPNVYQKSGRLQFIVIRMVPGGEGLLQKRFQELKEKLSNEGLFAPERKRKLPYLPRAIGIVTSASGAAIHDIMVRLRERMPQIPSYLLDVRVQGEGAAQEIAEAIRFLSGSGLVDVIIAGRGGGSLEDLWAFNEEVVVRAIFASTVPVISAVGHEVDTSLSDLVADVRAPTPTAAAEMVVPRRDDLLRIICENERRLLDWQRWLMPLSQEVDDAAQRLQSAACVKIEQARLKLVSGEARLRQVEPAHFLALRRLKVDQLSQKVLSLCESVLRQATMRLSAAERTLFSARRQVLPANRGEQIEALNLRLTSGMNSMTERHRSKLSALESRMHSLSPQRVLERGYAIVEHDGEIVKSAVAAQDKKRVALKFHDGKVNALVENRRED